jgi:hypothetical protein
MSKLNNLIITETEPTTLLKDFIAFLKYLKTRHIVLTPTSENISRKDLFEINQEMAYPATDNTLRTDQKFYPLLHLFYHLVLAGKLFQKTSEKGSKLVLKETERLKLFDELGIVERYFFLLGTLWIDTDWSKLQCGYFGKAPFFGVEDALITLGEQKPGKKIRLERKDNCYFGRMLHQWEHFLLYFSYFGFWEVNRKVTKKPDHPKSYFIAESITPLPFGVIIAPILGETRKLINWNLARRRELGEWNVIPGSPAPDEEFYEFLEQLPKRSQSKEDVKVDKGKIGDPFFLPFVPLFKKGELQKTLLREGKKFVDGVYIFKVALAGNLWRRIEISSNHTLLDLHNSIQRAYGFDDDHLYSFFMDNKPWSNEGFISPCDEGGPYVDEVRIGELGLFKGQNILYLFDYSTEWRFLVKLEEIRKESSKPKKPKIIEKKGKAPEQYSYY